MEIKKGDFIPTNWTGEPTEVMGFQHADLGHNIVDAIVFRSYDEKCKTYVWAVGTYPYINEKRNELVWERGDYYYTDSPDKLPEGLRMDRRDRIAVEGDLKLTKDAAALTDTNSMRELQPYETVKVSLPDGRALVIEASRDEQHAGAFIGLVDKNGGWRDLTGVEQYANYMVDAKHETPALVTHTWDAIGGDENPRDTVATVADLEKDEAKAAKDLASLSSEPPSKASLKQAAYEKACADMKDAMKRLYQNASNSISAKQDIVKSMKDLASTHSGR